MKILFLTAFVIFSFCKPTDRLTGRWETKPSANGNITGVLFKPDQTYVGYVNRKPFVSGVYQLQDSSITILEASCPHTGHYQLIFFADGDSLKFQPVIDSCSERKEGMSRLVFGRVKSTDK